MAECKHCGVQFTGKRNQAYCSLGCAVWSRVEVRNPDECWPWTAAIGTHGYGAFDFSGEHFTSHTAVLLLKSGVSTRRSRGSRFVAMHSCDNRACCNPSHISAGSQGQNLADARGKGRLVLIGPRGEQARTARLTSEDVIAIRSSSATSAELALLYRIKAGTVWSIRSRRTWKHI